jgi:hypothetical protein
MKKISTLFIIASIILIGMLFTTGKMDFNGSFHSQVSLFDSLLALFRTIVIIFAWAAGLALMIVITLVDVFTTLITKTEFPILHYVYDTAFLTFSKGWYWDQFNGLQLLIAAALLLSFGVIYLKAIPFRKNQVVKYNHYSSEASSKLSDN